MGDVVDLDIPTKAFIPADKLLEGNKGAFEGVVLIGYDDDGEFLFNSSYGELDVVLMLLERAKARVMAMAEQEDPSFD